MKKRKNNKAFSLVEMVVAMAVIAIVTVCAITVIELSNIRIEEDLDFTKARIAAENYLDTGEGRENATDSPVSVFGESITHWIYQSDYSEVYLYEESKHYYLVGATKGGKELFRLEYDPQIYKRNQSTK